MLLSLSLMPMQTTRPVKRCSLSSNSLRTGCWIIPLGCCTVWYVATTEKVEPNVGVAGSESPSADDSRFCLDWLDIRRSQSAASMVNAGRVTEGSVTAVEGSVSVEPDDLTGEGDASSTVTV